MSSNRRFEINSFARSILNEERMNSNSHIHFKDLSYLNEQMILTSKSNTSSATSSSILFSSTDDIVPPKPALPNKNGLSTSRLPS